jgi:hypothetical protein
MSHCFSMFFAFLFSFGHNTATVARHTDAFVPPAEFVSSSFEVPVSNRESLARHSAFNSYSEEACLSCRTMNNTSQPQLILRAQR